MTLNVYLGGNTATQEVTIASELFPNKFKILIVPYIPSTLYSKDKNNCKKSSAVFCYRWWKCLHCYFETPVCKSKA